MAQSGWIGALRRRLAKRRYSRNNNLESGMYWHMHISRLLCVIALLAMMLAGCGGVVQAAQQPPREQVNLPAVNVPLRQAPVTADPKTAIDKIYGEDGGYIAQDIDKARLTEIIGVLEFPAVEVYARYSDPKGGLIDVVIAKPERGSEADVREALYQYCDRRVEEFGNYDILDSLKIAQGAVVFEQGGYAIMLMTKDNEAAQVIIDQYIPL